MVVNNNTFKDQSVGLTGGELPSMTPIKRSRAVSHNGASPGSYSAHQTTTSRPGSARIKERLAAKSVVNKPLLPSSTVGGMVAIAPSPAHQQIFRPINIPNNVIANVLSSANTSVSLMPSINRETLAGVLSGAVSPACAKNASSNLTPLTANGAKSEKGLRQFSAMVCSKVEEKGITSYNEVVYTEIIIGG
jgi:hypothetical protein